MPVSADMWTLDYLLVIIPTNTKEFPLDGFESQFYLTNSFKSRNKVCTTKACKSEKPFLGLDFRVWNLALQYIAVD